MDKEISGRDAFGDALVEIGREDSRIVVLVADLSKATRSYKFAAEFPERFFNAGAAEQNMMGIAAGLSSLGLIPVACTFAMFAAGRAFEQIRNSIAYPLANVKIAAGHAGIVTGEDGVTHQAIEDIALMRSIPNMTVLAPADGAQTRQALRAAIKMEGPVYLRIFRVPSKIVTASEEFIIGKANILRKGSDVTIIACGIMVAQSLEAAELLSKEGIEAQVINMSTVKPIDIEAIKRAAEETGAIVTAEDHNCIGGLGGAVAEALVRYGPAPMRQVGMQDEFAETGNWRNLLDRFGLNTKGICEAVKKVLKDKK